MVDEEGMMRNDGQESNQNLGISSCNRADPDLEL